jgi:VIT1/CCC1 family predicted Fe2+/Mn2+ transporter
VAALDPSEKKRRIERLSSIREIVFGTQDGILTTAGVLAGLSGAVAVHSQVILAALASTAAGALSMGAGAYLGTRAETEVLGSELERLRKEAAAEPYLLRERLLHELEHEGLSREASYRVVQLLSSAPQALISTAEVKTYGLSRQALGSAAADGVTMGVAFLVGALVPLLPFILIPSAGPGDYSGLSAAMATTALALFAVGYFQGWIAQRKWRCVSGLHFLAVAMGAAVAGYLIGLAIAPLGGGVPIPPVP